MRDGYENFEIIPSFVRVKFTACRQFFYFQMYSVSICTMTLHYLQSMYYDFTGAPIQTPSIENS